jgi:L-threonylcarbamoyladenylate synthase
MKNTLKRNSRTTNTSAPEVLRVNAARPQKKVIRMAAGRLRRGELVVFPTETVYGLAGGLGIRSAEKRLREAKGRDPKKPMAVLVHSRTQARKLARTPAPVERLMGKFWPGPLTLVLEDRRKAKRSIGLRCPDHPLALAIAREYGRPIWLTSANKSGGPEARNAREAVCQLGSRVTLVLDGGSSRYCRPSTVYQWTPWKTGVIREGVIPVKKIEREMRKII